MKPKKVRAAKRIQGNLFGEARRIYRLSCEVGNFMELVLKKRVDSMCRSSAV